MSTDVNPPHRQRLLRGLTFDQLFAVRTIASTGSFREASKILCLSQPAISQRVQHIEQILGSPIFDRHTGIGVTLTATGRLFLEFCDQAMVDLDALWNRLTAAEGAERQSALTVTAPSDSIQYFLIRLLPLLRSRFPHLQLRITQSGSRAETTQQISSGAADIAFYRMPLDPALGTVAVMNEKLHLVAAPGHPILDVPRSGRPAALAEYSFATYSASMRSRQLVERWALKAGAALRVDIESQSIDVMKQAVARGGALSVMPGTAIGEALKEGELTVVEIEGMPVTRATSIAVRPGNEQSASVREFVELLIRITRAADDATTPEIHWAVDFRARDGGPVAV
jgi:DNA-binding transcriptional LysR family regulator